MALSKSTRIIILLAIDSAFFLLELIVGEFGSWRSQALLFMAKLTESQAMPYTHWPSLQIPFTWSVILYLFSPCTNLFTDYKVLQLNDVLSLCVGLWAVKVAHQKASSKMYTYGVWVAPLVFILQRI